MDLKYWFFAYYYNTSKTICDISNSYNFVAQQEIFGGEWYFIYKGILPRYFNGVENNNNNKYYYCIYYAKEWFNY